MNLFTLKITTQSCCDSAVQLIVLIIIPPAITNYQQYMDNFPHLPATLHMGGFNHSKCMNWHRLAFNEEALFIGW